MSDSKNPKVFISHATEDKDRFVIDFAKKLRKTGIDAWVDEWEMLPGDSLVDKIFNQGLSNADFFIIVLSNVSISKPWVMEELNHAVIKRIESGTKIIPVVIDECEVPEALKSILWIKILELENYEDSFNKIKDQIFGNSLKPELGNVPNYTSEEIIELNGLNKTDSKILKILGDFTIQNNESHIDIEEMFCSDNKFELNLKTVLGSIEILEDEYLIDYHETTNSRTCRLTKYGLHEYCKSFMSNYEGLIDEIGGLIVNEEVLKNSELSSRTNKPIILIDNILDLLEDEGLLEIIKYCSGDNRILKISEKLKRKME